MHRSELTAALQASRAQMEAALEGLTDAQMEAPGVMDGWSVKDLLSHLIAWEAEAIRYVARVRLGQKPKPIAWDDAEVEALNAKWYKEAQDRSLESVLADFRGVRKQLLRQVDQLTDGDLQRLMPNLKDTSLLQVIRAESLNHEAEHLAHILEWRKNTGV